MHPVVEAYIAGRGSILEGLQACPEPRSLLEEATLALRLAFGADGREAEKAFRKAEKVARDGFDNIELGMILIELWASLSAMLGRREEARALANRFLALVTPETPPELRIIPLVIEGLVVSNEGDKRGRERVYEQVLQILPENSRRRRTIVWDRAIFFGQMGRGSDAETDLSWLEARCDEGFPMVRLAAPRAFNAAETGDVEGFRRHHAELQKDPVLAEFGSRMVASDRVFVELMSGTWQPTGRDDPEWALSTHALLDGRPEEALEVARRYAQSNPHHCLALGPSALPLIRAELACRNAGAALRLLGERRLRGGQHYLDDFFLARIELLAGSRAAAVWHFGRAMEACDRYGAAARLEFETRLALEMSPADVLALSRGRAAEPPARLEKVAPGPSEARGCERLVGVSRAMRAVRGAVIKMAPMEVPVLITGETGTGKELVARALHEESPRREKPFLAINCGAIAEGLLESELFGHEKGAFTGAVRARKGLFEEAGGSTVLLDEIGEISPRLQLALLRVLETGEVRPVGSSRTRRISCRIVAATNAPLGKLVAEGGFRKDLLYRLRRLEIAIPPLRDRRDDVLPLADRFFSEGRPAGDRVILSEELRRALRDRDWPGNVRELRNEIERMRMMASDKTAYDLADLSPVPAGAVIASSESAPGPARDTAAAAEARGRAEPEDIDDAEQLAQGKSCMRRLDRLRGLFGKHGKLTRQEAAGLLGVSLNTATRYLRALSEEGAIEKVRPNDSPRTHYFQLRPAPPKAT